jgi:hypothetical protein
MTDSIIPTDDLASARDFIASLRRLIDDRRQEYHEKIQYIRQRAQADERYEEERFYFETEPLRKQMETMILRVADYESLRMPPPTIIR